MPNTKTIELTGSETEVRFGENYPYFWVRNHGGGDVYMSALPGIVPGADGVTLIPAGEGRSTGDLGQANALYFLGEGKIEISPQHNAVCPFFKRGGKGGDINDFLKAGLVFSSAAVLDETLSTNQLFEQEVLI
ncbi:MAG: hypothetical protein NC395_12030 [Prevotella sp.]|nr:hypothetical protein [Prevotella sp.]